MTRSLPDGWAWARLEAIASSKPKAITDGPFGSNLKTEHYTAEGPLVIRLQNIGNGVFRDERAHISQSRYEERKGHAVEPGDLLIAALGEELPRACVAPSWLPPAVVKADCFRVRLHPEINAHYVAIVLNSPPMRDLARSMISGVGRPRINLGKARGFTIPLPPAAEQDRIVAAIEKLFSHLDSGVESLEGVQQRLKKMRRAVLRAATEGEILLNGTKESRSGSRWRSIPLSQIAEVHLGRQRSPKDHHGPNMRPYLRAANVTWAGLSLEDVMEMNFEAGELEHFRLAPGDILLSEASGSASAVGKPAIWNGEIADCCFQNTLIRVRPKSMDTAFLFLVFQEAALNGRFAQSSRGVGIHHLGKAALAAWPIPCPSEDDQRRTVQEVDRHLSVITALERAVVGAMTRAANLRRRLLRAAFDGQLIFQDPNDEPASVLLKRIAATRAPLPHREVNHSRGGGR